VTGEPFGVVGAILPFNWPPIHCGGKLAPALAAGNTVVIKPGEQTPLTVIRIVELLQDVFPHVIHVVPAGGLDVSAALVEHPDVRKITWRVLLLASLVLLLLPISVSSLGARMRSLSLKMRIWIGLLVTPLMVVTLIKGRHALLLRDLSCMKSFTIVL
jgi:hypothetical protein